MKIRQMEIILYLNNKKFSTLKELSEIFEVSKRTIIRDLDFISSLGIPIYTKSGYQGGVYLDNNYSFDKSFFTPSEVNELVLAIHIMENLSGNKNKNQVIKKLELLLPSLTIAKENEFFQYVKVDPILKDFNINSPLVKTINQALDEEVYLLITYDKQEYQIAPLYYYLRANGIYLCANVNQENLFFHILKIQDFKITNLEFNREDFI